MPIGAKRTGPMHSNTVASQHMLLLLLPAKMQGSFLGPCTSAMPMEELLAGILLNSTATCLDRRQLVPVSLSSMPRMELHTESLCSTAACPRLQRQLPIAMPPKVVQMEAGTQKLGSSTQACPRRLLLPAMALGLFGTA